MGLPGGGSKTRTGAEAESSIPISLLQFSLASPLPLPGLVSSGARFIREMRAARVPLYTWTVNEDAWMRWVVRSGLDGIITDDPARFLEVCRKIEDEDADADGKPAAKREQGSGQERISLATKAIQGVKYCAWIALVEFAQLIYLVILLWKHGGPGREVRESLQR